MLDLFGRAVIAAIEQYISLASAVAIVSALAALVLVYILHTVQGLLSRSVCALAAGSLALNAVTPYITIDPPWLAALPLSLAALIGSLVLLAQLRKK